MRFENHIGFMCFGLFMLIIIDAKIIFAIMWILLVLIIMIIEKITRPRDTKSEVSE